MDYNRMNTESKKTRIRRTNEQVDKAISDALTTLAGQMPLARITVNQLIAEAGIEAAVFFKRYSSIDDLIYEYVRSGSARPSRTGRWTRKAQRDTTSARSRACAATSTATGRSGIPCSGSSHPTRKP